MSDAGKTIVGGRTRLDGVIDDLAGGTSGEARPGKVASPRGTIPIEERKKAGYINEDAGQPIADPDVLFGATRAYLNYKRETFAHRLMLWYKLQGFDNREVQKLTGYSYHTVCQVTKQVWFQKAFVELAAEMGKDGVTTFLEGHVMPALTKVSDLIQNGDSDAIKLAAAREILDRYLGKSVAKTEIKSDSKIDVNVFDGAKLQEEYQRNQQILQGRGLNGSN